MAFDPFVVNLSDPGGTRFLRDAAFQAVKKGETTLQEINRVTFV